MVHHLNRPQPPKRLTARDALVESGAEGKDIDWEGECDGWVYEFGWGEWEGA